MGMVVIVMAGVLALLLCLIACATFLLCKRRARSSTPSRTAAPAVVQSRTAAMTVEEAKTTEVSASPAPCKVKPQQTPESAVASPPNEQSVMNNVERDTDLSLSVEERL